MFTCAYCNLMLLMRYGYGLSHFIEWYKQEKIYKLGIKKSSFWILGSIPAQGLSWENSMWWFEHVLSFIFHEFLNGLVDVIQPLLFFSCVAFLPWAISPSHAHVIFALKISHRNTLWTLQEFKLLIMYSMFILTQKNLGAILDNVRLKSIFGFWG